MLHRIFGAGFSIMSYNSDVNMVGQLDVMHNIFVGQGRDAYPVAGIAYSLGLFIGIIVFSITVQRKIL